MFAKLRNRRRPWRTSHHDPVADHRPALKSSGYQNGGRRRFQLDVSIPKTSAADFSGPWTLPFTRPELPADRDIRLLQVSRDDAGHIYGDFTVHSLDDASLEYQAISYHWGVDKASEYLWCAPAQSLLVSPSLFSMLNLLANESETAYYWIDAICINQEDKDEKSYQIYLMRDIFATAKQVIAFIGEPSDDSDEAIEFIGVLDEQITINSWLKHAGHFADIHESLDLDMATLTLSGLPAQYPSPGWTAFKNLLKRPWFQRIWCIQEVVVAKQVELRCGSKHTDWSELACAMGLLARKGLATLSTVDENGCTQFEGCLNISATFLLKVIGQELRPKFLQQCLLLCNRFHATLPEDKLYAVLGIASDATDLALRPDYTLTTPDLYVKVTGYVLMRDRFLHMMNLAGIGWPRQIADLPSWVPDFSCSRRSTILSLDDSLFHAAKPFAEFLEVNQRVHLSIAVFLVDQVTEAMPQMPEIIRNSVMIEELQSRTELLGWFKETRSWAQKKMKLPLTDDGEVTYWRTLLCDLPFSPGFATSIPTGGEYSERFGALLELLELSLLIKEDTEEARKALDAFHSILLEERENLLKIMLESRDRCLFCTQKGFIGLGPAGLEIGDDLCCIDGAVTPFLLRATSSGKTKHKPYRLVGEAFVHGLMNGEGRRLGNEERVTLV